MSYAISDALDHVMSARHKDYNRRKAETEIERDLAGEDGDFLVFDGELWPMDSSIEMSYYAVKGEDENDAFRQVDSAVKTSLPMQNFYNSE